MIAILYESTTNLCKNFYTVVVNDNGERKSTGTLYEDPSLEDKTGRKVRFFLLNFTFSIEYLPKFRLDFHLISFLIINTDAHTYIKYIQKKLWLLQEK